MFLQVLTWLTDGELVNLCVVEGNEYERVAVCVVSGVSKNSQSMDEVCVILYTIYKIAWKDFDIFYGAEIYNVLKVLSVNNLLVIDSQEETILE